MDQNAVVSEQSDSGQQLIKALVAAGFEVRVAFWAKPTEEEKWYLYLASPFVDEKGPAAAYDLLLRILRQMPDLGIDPFELKVIGLNDSLAKAALAVTKPKAPKHPFAVRNPKPYPGMTQFGGSTFGGVSMDGVYVYPPLQPATTT